MKDHLELKAYAKINLGLDVVRKREDGYHEGPHDHADREPV